MSVSPLTKSQLAKIESGLEKDLNSLKKTKNDSLPKEKTKKENNSKKKDSVKDVLTIGSFPFEIKKIKGKQIILLPLSELLVCAKENDFSKEAKSYGKILNVKGKVLYKNGYEILAGEKLELIFKIASNLNLIPVDEKKFDRKINIDISDPSQIDKLVSSLDFVLNVAVAKSKSREMGFICVFTDNKGNYWFKVSRGFSTAVSESLSSLETLIDEAEDKFNDEQKEKINEIYRRINSFYEN